jgi:hypothetical protein
MPPKGNLGHMGATHLTTKFVNKVYHKLVLYALINPIQDRHESLHSTIMPYGDSREYIKIRWQRLHSPGTFNAFKKPLFPQEIHYGASYQAPISIHHPVRSA